MTKEWAAQFPPSIRILAFDFKIEPWRVLAATAAHRWGECSCIELTIRVQEETPSLVKLVDTLMHELCHAIYWAYGTLDEDKEERICSTMGTAWAQVWRDNPLLLDWLSRACAEINATSTPPR